MPDDVTLLRRYAETRDEIAFAELVRRHIDGVHSVALRRVGFDAHLARDVAQNVFIVLARDARRLSRHPVLTGWLYTTTRHVAANAVRSETRRRQREQTAEAMNDALAKAPPEAGWEQMAPVLEAAIDELGEADRLAVLLRFIDRRSFADIGTVLQVTEDAARKRVERALEKLRATLGRHGVVSTGSALAGTLTANAVVAAPAGLLGAITEGALASAAAGGSAATFWGLGKISLGVAAATIVVGGATLALQHPADVSRPAVADASPSVPAPRTDSRATGASLAALPTAASDSGGRPPSTASTTRTRESAPPVSSPAFPSGQIRQWLAAANDPAVFARLTASGRALTLQRYSHLIDQFQLTAEQTEAFLRLLDDKRQAPMDLAVASLKNGLDPRDDVAGFQSRVAAEKSAVEKRISALLGRERYLEYQAYNRQLSRETIFIRLNEQMGGTEQALTAEQTTRLQQLMEENRTTSVDLSEAARAFLSPAQVDALQDVLEVRETRKNQIPTSLPPADPTGK